MITKLTDRAVLNYKPKAKRRRIRDALAKSLFLVIEPSGTKSWQMRFRTPSGRIGKLTLGRVDFSGRELKGDPEIGQPLSLAAARQLAAKVHRERELGHDPIAEHKARKHRQRAELIHRSNNTFAAARTYIEEHAKLKQRRWPETARLLGMQPNSLQPIAGGLAERWSEKPVGDIDGHDIWCAVDEARRQGVPGMKARNKGASEARARTLHAVFSALFTWLQRQRRVTSNPSAGLPRPAAPRPRERTLSNDEIRLFWQACDAVGEPFGAIFKLLLLTGARLNEVAGMRRPELHASGSWQLPGSRTKNKRPHKLILPPMALALIPPGPHDLVFTTTGTTPPSAWSRAKRRLDTAMLAVRAHDASIAPWRLHDLRRTAVTGMAELGVSPT